MVSPAARKTTVHSSDFGALETRVSVLSDEVHGIRQSIVSLHSKIDQQRAIPWGAVTTGLGALGLLGAVVIWAFTAYISQIQTAILTTDQRITSLTSLIVPRAELEDRRIVSNQRLERIEASLDRLADSAVPRGELEERWRAQDAQVLNVQRQVDQVRNDFGSSYSLKDALSGIEGRLDRLESIRLRPASSP